VKATVEVAAEKRVRLNSIALDMWCTLLLKELLRTYMFGEEDIQTRRDETRSRDSEPIRSGSESRHPTSLEAKVLEKKHVIG
jgi:hypothetical protein